MKMAQAAVDFQIQQLEQEKQEEQEEQKEHLQEEKVTIEIPFLQEKPLKELNQDIFLNDKAIKIDNNSKVKVRNFLTNVSYKRITTADFNNNNFVIDCFTFMIVYMNPFYLERKFESVIEREFVNVLWAYLMPETLYRYINIDENVKTLNKIKVKYQDGKDIITEFLKKDSSNFNSLSAFLRKNAILYQYLFGNLFPKCFSRVNDYGINAKILFNKYYHSYNLQKNMLDFVKEEQKQEQKQEQQQIEQKEFDSQLNMTSLFDVQNDDDDNNDNIIDQNNENKEDIAPKIKKVKNQKRKRMIRNSEEKKQLREAKKKKLLEQLNENTEKILKIKGKK